MFLLAAFMWFWQPAPLDMPEASSYLVTESDGSRRIEDRFDEIDLWTSHAVLCRWKDNDGRYLTISRLDIQPPVFSGSTLTRTDERRSREEIPLGEKGETARFRAISMLAPFDIPEEPAAPRQTIRGMTGVRHYRGTNDAAVVCAFLPEKHPYWYLAVWELVDGDDADFAQKEFEDEFLGKWDERVKEGIRSEDGIVLRKALRRRTHATQDREMSLSERELLRMDVQQSVTNYPSWHVTAAPEFVVIDDLPEDNPFVSMLTNELSVMRAKYAETVPSPISAKDSLCVARIFKDRDEYHGTIADNGDTNSVWSAAHWSPIRREIVAFLPPEGATGLLKTFRHEAFHQYLSYATAFAGASLWLNEGYAEYFEDGDPVAWPQYVDIESIGAALPGFMMMDDVAFYAETQQERQLNYLIARSIAYFLEKGAPNILREPFKDVKERYVKALIASRDARVATAEAFGDAELLKRFIEEWTKFWKEN